MDHGISLLDLQIRRHERQELSESHLARTVNWAADFVRSPEADSLSAMKRLRSDIEQNQKANNAERVQELEKQIKDLVKSDQSTLQWRREVSQYGSGLLKTGALFFPGARGRVAAAFLYGVDQARLGDGLSMQVLDGGLGALKGGLMHKAMSSLGAGTVGIAGKGVMIGMASRGLDIGLDRRSYAGANGFELTAGLSKLGSHIVDPAAWMADAGTFVVAHGLVKGANSFTGGLVENCRPVATIGTGFSFGMTSGALNEIDRQRSSGEDFSFGKIVARSLVQGGFDAVAAIPGGLASSPGSAGSIRDSLKRFFTREPEAPVRATAALAVAVDTVTMRPHVRSIELLATEKGEADLSRVSKLKLEMQAAQPERTALGETGDLQSPVLTAEVGSYIMKDGKLQRIRVVRGDGESGGDKMKEKSEAVDRQKSQPSKNAPEKYLVDQTDSDGTRSIVKVDGTRVTIGPNGKFKVEYPEGHAKLLREQELLAKLHEPKKEKEPRQRHEPPDFSHIPLAERPVNVGSSNAELVARETSNFEHSPFVLDGRQFASVEGFYVWLKWSGDPAKQALAQNMHGAEAKKFGKPSKNTTAEYDGQTIVLGSPEHHALIKRAIQAKMEHHPDLARRFAETHPRPLLHDLGYPEPPSRLPAKDFCRILTEVRQGLVDGTIVTKDGPVSRLSEKARMAEASKESFPVSDIMRSWSGDQVVGRNRNLDLYAQAFEGFEHKVTRLLAAGGDTLSFEMPNGHVLKITSRTLGERFGSRPFDLHMVEKGSRTANGVSINYFIQPKADTAVSYSDYTAFCADLKRLGYVMGDGTQEQLGKYNGAVKLLDPFAVEKVD